MVVAGQLQSRCHVLAKVTSGINVECDMHVLGCSGWQRRLPMPSPLRRIVAPM
jgi:hypothetical protein